MFNLFIKVLNNNYLNLLLCNFLLSNSYYDKCKNNLEKRFAIYLFTGIRAFKSLQNFK